MFRHRSTRALASLGVILSLALSAMAGPAVILGAQASAVHTATALPGSVSPGANVAFDVSFRLADSETSTLAQLHLTALTPNGATLLGLETGSPSQGACTVGDDLSCTFGAVPPGVEVTLRVVYETPSSGDSMTVVFNFNTTGVTTGPKADKGKNSHGDSYETLGTVDLNGTGDFAGAYIEDGSAALTVFDNQALHATRNPQSTLVNAPEDAIGVTVGEATFTCPATIGTCFGQWSVISVNDGFDYGDLGEAFSVVIGYKGNIGNANFVHTDDAGNIIETITETCSSDPPPFSDVPCKIITMSGGSSFATLWISQNGRVSGY